MGYNDLYRLFIKKIANINKEEVMKKNVSVEVCAGSVEDCIKARRAGADYIELNNAIHMGGLTPSLATLVEAKKVTDIPLIAMVRPRGGGFYYNEVEKRTMLEDAKYLLEYGADGLVFGFLNEDCSVDKEMTKKFVDLCHDHSVDAVFHRAFDRTSDPFEAIEVLIELGVDRILTSGLKPTADQGIDLLSELQNKYGDKIELLVGSGVNSSNVETIMKQTNINRVHSSFKSWFTDGTTAGDNVSYSYSDEGDYEGVDYDKLKEFMDLVKSSSVKTV